MIRLAATALLSIFVALPAYAQHEAPPDADEEIETELGGLGLGDLPPELLAKIEPADLIELLAATEVSEAAEFMDDDLGFDVVAVVVPVTLFSAILLGVISTNMLRSRKQAQLHQTLRLMIEKGAEIPPELFTPPVPANADLRRGLVLVGVGLSVVLLIGLIEGFAGGEWAIGLIPGFIGAAYLITWRFSQRAESR